MILVTCIIPMYNSSQTILRALNSIKFQNFDGSFQIIVVDDGSIDNSVILVEKFRDENLDLCIDIFKKKNGGVSSARNFAMDHATGEYIAFLDSDDEWNKEKIQIQIEIMVKNPQIDLLGCRNSTSTSVTLPQSDNLPLIKLNSFNYVLKTSLITSSVIMRRLIYVEIGGFNENMRYSEDMNYWLRAMQKFNCYLLVLPLIILESNNLVKHSGGLSTKRWEMEKGELENIKYIYKTKQINLMQYFLATVFSLLKYLRRLILLK